MLNELLELACLKALVQVNILANGSTRPDQCYQLQKIMELPSMKWEHLNCEEDCKSRREEKGWIYSPLNQDQCCLQEQEHELGCGGLKTDCGTSDDMSAGAMPWESR